MSNEYELDIRLNITNLADVQAALRSLGGGGTVSNPSHSGGSNVPPGGADHWNTGGGGGSGGGNGSSGPNPSSGPGALVPFTALSQTGSQSQSSGQQRSHSGPAPGGNWNSFQQNNFQQNNQANLDVDVDVDMSQNYTQNNTYNIRQGQLGQSARRLGLGQFRASMSLYAGLRGAEEIEHTQIAISSANARMATAGDGVSYINGVYDRNMAPYQGLGGGILGLAKDLRDDHPILSAIGTIGTSLWFSPGAGPEKLERERIGAASRWTSEESRHEASINAQIAESNQFIGNSINERFGAASRNAQAGLMRATDVNSHELSFLEGHPLDANASADEQRTRDNRIATLSFLISKGQSDYNAAIYQAEDAKSRTTMAVVSHQTLEGGMIEGYQQGSVGKSYSMQSSIIAAQHRSELQAYDAQNAERFGPDGMPIYSPGPEKNLRDRIQDRQHEEDNLRAFGRKRQIEDIDIGINSEEEAMGARWQRNTVGAAAYLRSGQVQRQVNSLFYNDELPDEARRVGRLGVSEMNLRERDYLLDFRGVATSRFSAFATSETNGRDSQSPATVIASIENAKQEIVQALGKLGLGQ